MSKMHAGGGLAALVMAIGLAACDGRSDPASMAEGGAPARSLDVPAGAPDVLYAPPPDIPQLQNRDPRFRAPFERVSATERYIDGEYLYTDFIYDDDDSTYPSDGERYAGNAADLMEFRIAAPAAGGLALRFSLITLVALDSTIAVVAFDSDQDTNTGNNTLPRDPGMPFPGTDQVLTTWGAGAEWSRWNGSSWDTVPLEVHTDLDANQITITVPPSVADLSGQWRTTLALGLFDAASGGWLALGDGTAPKIVNLGFRFSEDPGDDKVSPSALQKAALAAGEPTRFANVLDFDLLRNHGSRDNVPTHGQIHRMFASRLEWVQVESEPSPAVFVRSMQREGKDRTSRYAQFLSPLQPYLIYIPTTYDPARPTPITFTLHGATGHYYWIGNNDGEQVFGEQRSSIIVSPGARGGYGWYRHESEYDFFEAWNDAARHYNLDPDRASIIGFSMGAHGAYRLGLLYPHLFARAATLSAPPAEGIWIPGVGQLASRDSWPAGSPADGTLTNRWLENARNLPYFNVADALSELVPLNSQIQQNIGPEFADVQSFDSLGYRYTFWALAVDHDPGASGRRATPIGMGTNFPAIRDFFGDHPVEREPFHVTYARMPSSDHPALGLVHNRAYWLSGIELRETTAVLAKGVIDALSLGFGQGDPVSTQSNAPGLDAESRPYLETKRTWGEPGKVPIENRIVIKATNIASVTIDRTAARVDCKVQLDIESDGPVEVTLLGCAK